jgi:hypothetical protein
VPRRHHASFPSSAASLTRTSEQTKNIGKPCCRLLIRINGQFGEVEGIRKSSASCRSSYPRRVASGEPRRGAMSRNGIYSKYGETTNYSRRAKGACAVVCKLRSDSECCGMPGNTRPTARISNSRICFPKNRPGRGENSRILTRNGNSS